jgi:hypothetical protein
MYIKHLKEIIPKMKKSSKTLTSSLSKLCKYRHHYIRELAKISYGYFQHILTVKQFNLLVYYINTKYYTYDNEIGESMTLEDYVDGLFKYVLSNLNENYKTKDIVKILSNIVYSDILEGRYMDDITS